MKNINWVVRIKNKAFWVALIVDSGCCSSVWLYP